MSQVTKDQFIEFIRGSMGIDESMLPDDSIDINFCYLITIDTISSSFIQLPDSIYQFAFLNLAAAYLVEYALDQPGKDTFSKLRGQFGLSSFNTGIIQSSSDQGTSAALLVPDWVKNANLFDLQMMKTPWGRQYLSLSQRLSPAWGIV